ncbi:dihydrolipoyl dehydrogenase [Gemmatimonadota bacterium]
MVMGSIRQEAEVAVIGAGPGGYVAALRLADLGKEVLLIEEREQTGGTCLLEGCIPSKALITAVEIAETAKSAQKMGLTFGEASFDPDVLREWKDSVITKLSTGIDSLLKRRGVEVVQGRARFDNNRSLSIEGGSISGIDFRQAVIATGSRVIELPAASGLPVWSSTEALQIPSLPERLLVVGGGYIGLELGLVYAGLGSQVSVVEFLPRLLMGADPDLVKVMMKHAESRLSNVMSASKVVGMEHNGAGFKVAIEQEGKIESLEYDQVLVSVGRKPNTDDLGLEHTDIEVDERGTISTNEQCRTSEKNIYAIGDVAPGPMLAHKASREGKVAAEVIADHKSGFDNRAIPAVVFTSPEIAWTGITEVEAKDQGLKVNVGKFPLSALGRAWTLDQTDGLVKVIADTENGLLLGIGMVGPHASELIAEGTLALEMGATLEDLMVTIHPHPTLSEALNEAAEVAAGSPTHVHPVRKPT